MSYQGSPTSRSLRSVFSFTGWGVLFSALSALILLIGVLRMELAAILWGSAFILLALYSLLANRIMQAVMRRFFEKTPDPIDFTLFATGVFPRSEVTAELKAEMPRFAAPGMRARFEIFLHWPGRNPLHLSCDLRGGGNRRLFDFSPSYRGRYQSREIRIVLSDLLGFTRWPVSYPLAEQLRVFPAVQPEEARRPPRLEGGQEENLGRRRWRSEELLEVRKYFPGDDIRKVHWKVFAHTSELFLRIGEEIPPPESRFFVVLDTAPTEAVPPRIGSDYLDVLVENCAAILMEVLSRGYQVYFTLCSVAQVRQVTPEKRLQILGELAGVWWDDRYTLELPPFRPYQILAFSSPGSGNLPRLLGDLRKLNGEVRLFFPELPIPPERPSRSWVHSLMFRPDGIHFETARRLSSAELEEFGETLNREAAQWSRGGKWKVTVETI
jgi:uncharacterized protein (DUF58 family)